MHGTAFDGITREFGEVATRRSVFRLLGGAALSAGLVLGAGGENLAKGKGKNKNDSRGRNQAQGQASAEGKKGKKVTICFQDKTVQEEKQAWNNKDRGGTLGA